MKDRPILFSAPMVRAILAGTKTQTRRVMATQPMAVPDVGKLHRDRSCTKPVIAAMWQPPAADGSTCCLCPYGVPGDRLWVRETFFAWGRWETRYSAKKGRDEWHFVDMTLECGEAYEYPATGGQPQPMGGKRHRGGTTPAWWKRPAIHMPRWASRITLEITSVRVERLQEISEADARAEGVEWDPGEGGFAYVSGLNCGSDSAAGSFQRLWVSINGPESWDANPWVWAISFNRVEHS